jgi:hypothetical protein
MKTMNKPTNWIKKLTLTGCILLVCVIAISNCWIVVVKREVPGVLHEVQQMRVRTAERLHTVHAKCVIPDHLAATGQPDLVLGN